MKEKLAKLLSWLPTIILAAAALVLAISVFLPSHKEKTPSQENDGYQAVVITASEEKKEETELVEIKSEDVSESFESSAAEESYLLNTNSKKFHLISCKSGQKTKESNRSYLSDREKIIEMGYSPCKSCNP